MAQYINSRSQPLLIAITREDAGIYWFGSRRIIVKLEGGRIRVRIGGGHTSIDDFVSAYGPQEYEK